MSSEEEQAPEPAKKKRKTRSVVWNFFENNGDSATCTICNEEFPCTVTTVLHRHLNKEHNQIVQNAEKDMVPLEDRIINWIIVSMIPLHSIDNDAFRLIFSEIPPSRNKIRYSLEQKFNEEKNKLKQNLQNVQSKVSFTVDMWSANFKDFLGVTVHFVDNNFTLKSSVIGIKRMHSHRGKEIAEKFFDILQDYNLINKMGWITTDNHSNNDTFLYELGILFRKKQINIDFDKRHVRCICHVINLVVNDILNSGHIEGETNQAGRSRRLSGDRKPRKSTHLFF